MEQELKHVKYVRLSDEMVAEIEEFRATKRPVLGFSEAMRELISIGLKASKPPK